MEGVGLKVVDRKRVERDVREALEGVGECAKVIVRTGRKASSVVRVVFAARTVKKLGLTRRYLEGPVEKVISKIRRITARLQAEYRLFLKERQLKVETARAERRKALREDAEKYARHLDFVARMREELTGNAATCSTQTASC